MLGRAHFAKKWHAGHLHALERATVRSRTVAAPCQPPPATSGLPSVSHEAASASGTRQAAGPLLDLSPLSSMEPARVRRRPRPRCTTAPLFRGPPELSYGFFPLSLFPSNLPDNIPLPLVLSCPLHGRSAAADRRSDSGTTAPLSSPYPLQHSRTTTTKPPIASILPRDAPALEAGNGRCHPPPRAKTRSSLRKLAPVVWPPGCGTFPRALRWLDHRKRWPVAPAVAADVSPASPPLLRAGG